MNIIAKKLTGGGKTLSFLLGIVVVLCSAHIAQAGHPIYWKGGNGSEENPVNVYSKGCWTGSDTWSGNDISKNPCSDYNMHYGFAAGTQDMTAWLKCDGNDVDTAIADYIITHSGDFIFTSGSFKAKSYYVGYSTGDDSKVTKKSGTWKITENMDVGYGSKSIGVLTINGGTLDVASNTRICLGYSSGSSGTLNLNGGVIKTRRIVNNNGAGVFNLNGGTLQANADNTRDFIKGITVNVVSGGTIDNGGFAITIPAALNGSGSLTFKGSGTTTVSGSIENGKIVVDSGTVNFSKMMYIGKNKDTVGLLEINGGIVNPGDSIDVGNYGTGVLTINDGTLVINSEKRICLGYYSGSIGTMNLNGGILKTRRIVKGSGNSALNINGGMLQANADNTEDFIKGVTVNVVSGGTIDNGGFAITIPAALNGSGSLTFKGSGITTLSGSVGYSGVTRVAPGTKLTVSKSIASAMLSHGLALFGAPVIDTSYTVLSCDEDLSDLSLGNVTCPVATGCDVKFSDDKKSIVVTPTGAIKAGYWTGIKDANMSDADNWSDGAVPAEDTDIDLSAASTVNADLDRTFGKVTMGSSVVTFTGSLTARLFSDTSKVAVGVNSTVTLNNDLKFSSGNNSYICNYVGDGGMFVVTGNVIATKDFGAYLDPCKESVGTGVVSVKGLVNEASKSGGFRLVRGIAGYHANWLIGEGGLSGSKSFGTYDKASTAKIIAAADFTVSSVININSAATLELDPAGHKITIGSSCTGSGATTVSGSGTVALVSGVSLSTGDITLGVGTTLALYATSRDFTLANKLNLPTTGKATIRIDGTRLKSGDNVIATLGNEATIDNVTLDPASTALNGRKVSLRVDDSNLVLTIKSTGTVCIVR